jgi:competence transcription factor ComK
MNESVKLYQQSDKSTNLFVIFIVCTKHNRIVYIFKYDNNNERLAKYKHTKLFLMNNKIYNFTIRLGSLMNNFNNIIFLFEDYKGEQNL